MNNQTPMAVWRAGMDKIEVAARAVEAASLGQRKRVAHIPTAEAARSGLILEGQRRSRLHLKFNDPWSHEWGPVLIPGVGQLTALAFVAAIDDPSRIRRSRDIGAYLGLVPRRYQSGEVDYTGGISKCGDRRVRTLLYEAANVMLTRYKGQLKLKDWAFAIAKRSTMRKARVALARRLAIIMHAMLRDGTEFASA